MWRLFVFDSFCIRGHRRGYCIWSSCNTDSPTPPTAINGRYVSHLTAWKRQFSMKDIKRFRSRDTIFIKMYDWYIDIFFLICYLSKICWKTYRLSAFANTGLYHVTALFTPEFKTRQYGGGTVLVCIPNPSPVDLSGSVDRGLDWGSNSC